MLTTESINKRFCDLNEIDCEDEYHEADEKEEDSANRGPERVFIQQNWNVTGDETMTAKKRPSKLSPTNVSSVRVRKGKR
jgi:hypothetical protein